MVDYDYPETETLDLLDEVDLEGTIDVQEHLRKLRDAWQRETGHLAHILIFEQASDFYVVARHLGPYTILWPFEPEEDKM